MDEAICPLDYDAPPPNGGVVLDDDLAGNLQEHKWEGEGGGGTFGLIFIFSFFAMHHGFHIDSTRRHSVVKNHAIRSRV
jgi:hypothetical protein